MNFAAAFINAVLLTALVGHCHAAPLAVASDLSQSKQRAIAKDTVARQIAFFNSGNFQQAAQTGYEILRRDPKNSLARYYYAQTMFKLKRIDDAKSQFAECYKTSSDPTMQSHCFQALKTLASPVAGAPSSSVSTSGATPSADNSINQGKLPAALVPGASGPATSDPATSDTAKSDPATSDPALISRKLQIMTEGSANIEHKRRQMLIEVGRAKEKAAEHMNGIEQFYRRPIVVNYRVIRWEQYENPEYSRELERSQRELKVKIEDLNAEFNRREAEILADCKARAAVYDQVSSGLKSQQKIGTSQIQLTPQHSNGFVRHYVNYDGSEPVSLKARQGELTNTKSVTKTKAVTGTNKP